MSGVTWVWIGFIVFLIIAWKAGKEPITPTSKRTYIYSSDDPIIPKGWLDAPFDSRDLDSK